jgi:beta-lactamase class D
MRHGARRAGRVAALLLLLLVVGAGAASAGGQDDPFAALGVQGAFALLDTASGKLTVMNRRLAGRRFFPCSTFKIANTLIGLETGVIPDEHFSQRWDGVDRGRPEWNRDQDLASAMKFSVVWFYQEVARRIGRERMSRWVRKLRYGNRDISGAIDGFWLLGPLAISPLEQVDFMRRLRAGELPVTAAHAALVLKLIELERGDGWVFHGKTGQCSQDGHSIGWLVGSVDRGGAVWTYALFVRGTRADAITAMRRPLAEELLRRHGVLPPR